MIGARIRDYRQRKGLKVADFAKLIGISQGSLSDIENGKTKPSADTLASIIRNTDIDSKWLMIGEGDISIPVSADRREYYEALPEPFQKMAKLYQAHPEKAWEFYAAALERFEKEKKGKK